MGMAATQVFGNSGWHMFFVVHLCVHPFAEILDNRLETLSLFVLVFISGSLASETFSKEPLGQLSNDSLFTLELVMATVTALLLVAPSLFHRKRTPI